VGSRHSLCREPRARVLGKEPWPRKILREPCAERDRRQSLCRRFNSLCRAFPALGKSPISSSVGGICRASSIALSIYNPQTFA
jgi:hypothetical protein